MADITPEYQKTSADLLRSEPLFKLMPSWLDHWFWLPPMRHLRFTIFLTLFYVIPYLVIWVIQWEILYRHAMIGIVFFSLTAYAIRRCRNWSEMGFRRDTLKPALLWFGGVTLFFVLFMLVAYNYRWVRVSAYPLQQNWLLVFYFFVVSPSQEFVSRSLLFAEMKRIGISKPLAQILISSVLFALVHIHYHDWLTVVMTLGISLLWGWIYATYPNWLAVTLSHSILGSVALLTHII